MVSWLVPVIFPGTVGVAEEDIVNSVRIEVGCSCDQGSDDMAGEVVRTNRGKRTAKTTDRSSDCVQDVGLSHVGILPCRRSGGSMSLVTPAVAAA